MLGSEKFQIEFDYSAGKKPVFNAKKLTKGSDAVVIVSGPTVDGSMAKVSFQITRNTRNTSNNYDFTIILLIMFIY